MSQGDRLPAGKLAVEILRGFLKKYTLPDERVLLGPGIGEDAAVVRMNGRTLAVATDPITFATDAIGYYSVMVNANDIATTGAEPEWFTVTVLLPETGGNKDLAEEIFRQMHGACEALGVVIIGGHTEITSGLDRPIVVGQMMGEVDVSSVVRTAGARAGDMVLMTKGVSVEGTALIAREKEGELTARGVSPALIERAQGFLYDPGISVVEEARLACRRIRVHAMHDITEGGLANGLHEMAMAAEVEIEVEETRIPIYEASKVLCAAFGLDPMGLIGSGSLLIAAPPEEAEAFLQEAEARGMAVTPIGRITASGAPSVILRTGEGRRPLPPFQRDEIVKIF
jgi:hydrogenase maturation factor